MPKTSREILALATRERISANRSIFTTWRVIFIVFTDPDFLRLGRDTRDKHKREAYNPLPAGTILRFLARVRNVPSLRAFVSSERSSPYPFCSFNFLEHRSTSMCLLNREMSR